MKKVRLCGLPEGTPPKLCRLLSDAKIYDSSCSAEAAVYFINKNGGYYLKSSRKGALENEAAMTGYFHSKGIGAEVLCYISGDRDWLLTAALPGKDCTAQVYLSDPKRLCDTIASELRKLHETDFGGCPIPNRIFSYLSLAEHNYREGKYDASLFSGSFGFKSAEEAYRVLSEGKDALQNNVLLHGDYCLPNIMLDYWKPSGFIDVGNGGVGDRHIDIFWGIWSLWYNLKTDRYRERFLDAYGRDAVNTDLLRIIAAAEVFG